MAIPIDKKSYYSMRYPQGSKLRLTSPIDDPFTPKQVGDIFTVSYIDDACQIHGTWASGGSMSIIIGKDEFEIVVE